MRFEVQPYNPQWPQAFQTIKSELEKALAGVEVVSIEHVGSTSVSGLAAKPILDIDVVVSSANLGPASDALVKKGGYRNAGDGGVTGRIMFRKADAVPKRNLYICLDGCLALRNHLALRDTCRADDSLRDAYGAAKMQLAEKDFGHVDEYTVAKNEIVQRILLKAGLSEAEWEEIASQN